MVIVTSGSPHFLSLSENVGRWFDHFWRWFFSLRKLEKFGFIPDFSVGKLGFPISLLIHPTSSSFLFRPFPSRRAVLPVTTLPWSRRKCFREGKLQGLQDWAATCFRMFPLWSTWWFNKIWGSQKARWFLWRELEWYEPMTPDTVLSASQDHGLL